MQFSEDLKVLARAADLSVALGAHLPQNSLLRGIQQTEHLFYLHTPKQIAYDLRDHRKYG